MSERKIFFIGFDCCGAPKITDATRGKFRVASPSEQVEIAEDILFSRVVQSEPLKRSRSIDVFYDLICTRRVEKPIIEAFWEFRFLHENFPNSTFVLNTRSKSDWIHDRAHHRGGKTLKDYCRLFEVSTEQIKEMWSKSWDSYHQEVQSHNWNGTSFFVLDMDRASADDVQNLIVRSVKPVPQQLQKTYLPSWFRRLSTKKISTPTTPTAPVIDHLFADAVASHCIGIQTSRVENDCPELRFKLFADWDGQEHVRNWKGSRWPLRRINHCGQDCFVARPTVFKIARVQGVLNEILRLGRSVPVRIDMEDARRYGTENIGNPSKPLLAYNRKPDAKNVVLWPLPGYHDIGNEAFAHQNSPDTVPWDKKIDKVAWRGSLAGRSTSKDLNGVARTRPSQDALAEFLEVGAGDEKADELLSELYSVTRFRLVSDLSLHPEFDVSLTLPYRKDIHNKIKTSTISYLFKQRVKIDWFYNYKYAICISGADTGSNFFTIANSRSIVFKEEDSWDLFYTSSFRPWEHYIPIKEGGGDILEKLEWAKSNPADCSEMTRRRLSVCAKFADVNIRKYLLHKILDNFAR